MGEQVVEKWDWVQIMKDDISRAMELGPCLE